MRSTTGGWAVVVGVSGLTAAPACSPARTGDAPITAPASPTGVGSGRAPEPRCGEPPPRETAPHTRTGTVAAWHAPLDPRTGELRVTVVGQRIVVLPQGGRSLTLDLETGARCAELVALPSGASAETPIEPYSARSAAIQGVLIGPSGLCVGAVDLRTGAPRWSRRLVGSDDFPDDYALRDGLRAVEVGPVAVLGFYLRQRNHDRPRFEELVVALDPATGAERWRRSMLQHPAGEPLQVGGQMRLETDGALALVQVPGRLSALDPNTGTEVWSTTWVPGPEPRLFAGDGRAALAFPGGELRILDAAHGQVATRVARLDGDITAAIVHRNALFVALEAEPGTASLVGLDERGDVRWQRRAAYSIARLRALTGSGAVYALEGNGRLWALDEVTGAERWGMTLGNPYDEVADFALASTHAGNLRVLVPLDGLTAFDPVPGSRPLALAPFLRWEFERRPRPDGSAACHPLAVAWVSGEEEKSVWRRELPTRLRAAPWGSCEDAEMLFYRRAPRHIPASGLIGQETTADAVVVADASGILSLARADGRVLLDRAVRGDEQGLFFDSGTFELSGDPPCAAPARHAHIFARCGDRFLYFNGNVALLINARSWHIDAEGTVTSASIVPNGRPHETEAVITLGTRKLAIHGITTMR